MPERQTIPQGAVFLSYASQDAEAARRICEALREAGIVVWFDQSELRGGDAWDQSIRKQIKNCALFVPVVSEHTQTRLEGYFRLEWKLAEDRSHLMARGKPFIVPVTVDATSDQDAQVPESFLAVQWTKLPGGQTPAAFGERLKRLLCGPEAGQEAHAMAKPPAPASHASSSRTWMIPAMAGVAACAAVAIWQPWRKADIPVQAVPAAAPSSEARQLVAKAWAQMDKVELGPEELDIADGFCKRAAGLDPSDPDVWAAWSQVDSWYIYSGYDNSKVRQDAARSCAARALQLAPGSYEARLAQACYLVRGATVGTGLGEVSTFAPEAIQLLQQLLKERKDEPHALFALGILQRNLGRPEEARAAFARLARNPRYAATAWSERAWMEFRAGSYSAIEAPLARSLAIQPFWGNLGLKVLVSLHWHGDVASAKAALDELPVTVLQTDFGATLAYGVFSHERKPDEWLKFSRGIRRDWLQSNGAYEPVATFNGLAQRMAGRNDAARIEWQTALKLVEHALADDPSDAGLLRCKGELLTYLGDFAGAENALHQADELSGRRSDVLELALKIAEGKTDAALDDLESAYFTAAELRMDPVFDPLRNTPHFKNLLARAEADPKRAPQPQKGGANPSSQTISQD